MRPLGPRPAGARIALCVDAPAFPPTSARSRSRSAFRPSGRRQILRQLESGADRSGADCALRRQGRFARLRRHALGPDPLLGEGHQDRFLDHQRPGRGSRHKAGVSRGVSAAALSLDNFYEWKKTATGKQPYAIALANRRRMGMAGLWETWRSPAGERIRSFTIITTTPNELCAGLHNRMPVVLKPEAWPAWLGEEAAGVPQLKALLAPYPSDEMICWPVSARVGNVKNNDPSLIEPVAAA